VVDAGAENDHVALPNGYGSFNNPMYISWIYYSARNAKRLKCTECKKSGAWVGCAHRKGGKHSKECPNIFHLVCAASRTGARYIVPAAEEKRGLRCGCDKELHDDDEYTLTCDQALQNWERSLKRNIRAASVRSSGDTDMKNMKELQKPTTYLLKPSPSGPWHTLRYQKQQMGNHWTTVEATLLSSQEIADVWEDETFRLFNSYYLRWLTPSTEAFDLTLEQNCVASWDRYNKPAFLSLFKKWPTYVNHKQEGGTYHSKWMSFPPLVFERYFINPDTGENATSLSSVAVNLLVLKKAPQRASTVRMHYKFANPATEIPAVFKDSMVVEVNQVWSVKEFIMDKTQHTRLRGTIWEVDFEYDVYYHTYRTTLFYKLEIRNEITGLWSFYAGGKKPQTTAVS
jgi:hypothetical protein